MLLLKFGTTAKNIVNRLIEQGYKVYDAATGATLGCDVPHGFSSNILAVYND
jgi:hypothetical protein